MSIATTDLLNYLGTATELVVLALLVAAVYLSVVIRRPNTHWKIMGMATLLNLFSVVVLMVPVFISLAPGIGGGLGARGWAVLLHHALGLIGLALSLYLVGSYISAGKELRRCPTTRRSTHILMRLTFVFMILPLLMGLFLRFVAF